MSVFVTVRTSGRRGSRGVKKTKNSKPIENLVRAAKGMTCGDWLELCDTGDLAQLDQPTLIVDQRGEIGSK